MPALPRSIARRWSLIGLLLLTLALSLAGAPARAQTAGPPFDQQTLDELLAPIALYPDPLLTQVLIASTYPLEVVQAARFVDRNREMAPDALAAAAQTQPWDPSVMALVRFPSVLAMMDDKLDWTQKLGDAFVAQQSAVMDTVQALRARAQAAGNLSSNAQQTVVVQDRIIVIEPAQPQIVYVPFFNPAIVYGSWWWATPPRWVWAPPPWHRPPGWMPGWGAGWGPGVGWGRPIGAPPWIWHGRAPNWHDRNIIINNNNTIIVNNRPPQVWTPDPGQRRGIPRTGGRDAHVPRTTLPPGSTGGWPGRTADSRPTPMLPGSMTGNPMMGVPPQANHGTRPGTRPAPPHAAPGGNTRPTPGAPVPGLGVPATRPGAPTARQDASAAPAAPPVAQPAPAAPPATGATDVRRSAPPTRGGTDRDNTSRPGTPTPSRATP